MEKETKNSENLSMICSAIREILFSECEEVFHAHENPNFDMLASSLDFISDTESALDFYLQEGIPNAVGKSHGKAYFFYIGAMQCVAIQQDAVHGIFRFFDAEYNNCPKLKKIKDIRNRYAGHPINYKETQSFQVDPRWHEAKAICAINRQERTMINLASLVKEQNEILVLRMQGLKDTLETQVKQHRQKFAEEKLANHFAKLDYPLQKIGEIRERDFAIINLDIVKEAIDDFIAATQKRGYRDNWDYERKEFENSVKRLNEFLSGENEFLNEHDAHIYAKAIRSSVKLFAQMAQEIDADYSQSP